MVDMIERALLICAPSHQGGHGATGAAIAEALGIPFPVTVSNLKREARKRGYKPYDLWPWLRTLDQQRRAAAAIGREVGDG